MTAHASAPRVSLARARAIVCSHAASLASERVGVESALGRVLAEPVFARFASPHYRASAMDGIAVRAADTAAAAPASAETNGGKTACTRSIAVINVPCFAQWTAGITRASMAMERTPAIFFTAPPFASNPAMSSSHL